ncbi:PREDICTED: histone-lysine N-methyltransferase SETMAR-like [Rhagoletis zephyria]|uniref:histone-lysine N-methyltransferase SETMAR-like n=1 Tax=Rhagoletis zephyria TaxID=28612 RepID=UPI00081170F0|nr:PREDICTED: histone-lysine N-methyltransferase SETMAR-like [Rhagoletis zephyria]
MVKKIHKAVMDDCRLKVRELADIVGISKSTVHRVLAEDLEMRKLCPRWVPHLLTLVQNQCREEVSIDYLANNESMFELLPHAPYSPDLARYYFLFPNFKKWLRGQRFSSDEEMMSAVNGYFEEQDSSYYKRGIELIERRWEKSI